MTAPTTSSTSARSVEDAFGLRGRDCLSDFALDMLVSRASSLRTPVRRAPDGSVFDDVMLSVTSVEREHIVACSECETRLRLFVDAQAEAAPTVARLLAAAQAPASREVVDVGSPGVLSDAWARVRESFSTAAGLARWAAGSSTVVAAAVLAVMVWPPASVDVDGGTPSPSIIDTDPRLAEIRAKGTALRFFVKRGDVVRIGHSGELFSEGDALRFVVTTGAPSHLLVFGIEANGAVSAYYPFGGEQSAPVDVGAETPLAGSVVLDASPDAEFLGAVFSPDPLALDTVRQAVQSLVKEPGRQLTFEHVQALPLDGAVHRIELRKSEDSR